MQSTAEMVGVMGEVVGEASVEIEALEEEIIEVEKIKIKIRRKILQTLQILQIQSGQRPSTQTYQIQSKISALITIRMAGELTIVRIR